MIEHNLNYVGNNPTISVKIAELLNIKLFAKMELYNPTGSVKDRAASFVLRHLVEHKIINQNTMIIESSSGNFGVALAAYCKLLGLNFTCVVDPNISRMNKQLIESYGAKVIQVQKPDSSGGYLLERIKTVNEMLEKNDNAYWVNQYGNPLVAQAYYELLGGEICSEFDSIDYVFLGVSSCGTIAGLSKRIKESFPHARIIAVDVEGSVIFGAPASKRLIPGLGSSLTPPILKQAEVSDVVYVNEKESIVMCRKLLKDHAILAGGSSGSVMAAIYKYFHGKSLAEKKPVVVTVFADRGERYFDTVYSDEWVAEKIQGKVECYT